MTRTTMRKRSFGWRCTTIGKLSLVRSTPSCTVRVWPARTTSPSAWPPPWSGTASLRAPGRWTFPGSTRRRTTPGGWPASSARTSTPTRVPARRSSAPRSPTVNCTPASSPWPARPSPRCATGPEPAARSGQLPVHDVQVDVAEPGMPEAARDRTDDREPERLPQRHGRLVRTDDGVELHAPVPACPGARDDLLGEPATDAPPARRGGEPRPEAAGRPSGGDPRGARAGSGLAPLCRVRHPLAPGPGPEPVPWTTRHVTQVLEVGAAFGALAARRREWDGLRREWIEPH